MMTLLKVENAYEWCAVMGWPDEFGTQSIIYSVCHSDIDKKLKNRESSRMVWTPGQGAVMKGSFQKKTIESGTKRTYHSPRATRSKASY